MTREQISNRLKRLDNRLYALGLSYKCVMVLACIAVPIILVALGIFVFLLLAIATAFFSPIILIVMPFWCYRNCMKQEVQDGE